ncbi:MAG TPA: hypothetical protein VGY55_23380 [Pirellulales bacterium]|jgi:hypothetical protein|nr:hypothetical protein [Pirellulales bacterium]
MIARYNSISLLAGVPGIILQIAGQVVMRTNPSHEAIGALVAIAGTALLMLGLAYYALAKGRNPAWCLMGLLSIIGIIVLACLKDLAPDGREH